MALVDDVKATLLIADYIGIDAGGKINAIGAGVQLLGLQPSGLSAPQHLAVIIEFPPGYIGRDVPISIELRDAATGSVVSVAGPTGQLEALRVQQLARVPRPDVPGMWLPEDTPARLQVAMAFPSGLPLRPNTPYTWRLDVEGTHRKAWVANFQTMGPPPGPVVGGPTGPSGIPNVINPTAD